MGEMRYSLTGEKSLPLEDQSGTPAWPATGADNQKLIIPKKPRSFLRGAFTLHRMVEHDPPYTNLLFNFPISRLASNIVDQQTIGPNIGQIAV